MHEEWSGIELVGATAYGLRLYQNNSRLLMHVDKSSTHVISCILHIDHSEDSEPWPIVIEDFQGNTNEVILENGDMLFYEVRVISNWSFFKFTLIAVLWLTALNPSFINQSSKCFHGRPKPFKGSWYSSIFVHYYPKFDWVGPDRNKETHYAIPKHWGERPADTYADNLEDLVMVGTSMKEPKCEDVWCGLKDSVKWYGPAIEGEIITTGWTAKDEEEEEL